MTETENWLYDAHPATFRSNPLLFILLLVSVVGIPVLVIWWLKNISERLALSDSEILLERGLLSKQRTQLALSSVRTVRVTQSMFQRMFGIGNVEIFSAGDYAEIAIKSLPDPNRVRDLAARRIG